MCGRARAGQCGGMNETPPHTKRLQRTRDGRFIAGVCSGVGESVGIDPNIIRLAFGISVLFGGLGIGVYAVAWLLLPEEGKGTSIVQDLLDRQRTRHGPDEGRWYTEPPASPYGYGAPAPYQTDVPAPEAAKTPAAPREADVVAPEAAGPEAEKTTTAPRPAPGERPGTDG